MSSIYLKTFYDCAWFRSKLDKRHLNKQKWENLPGRLPTITLARRKKTDSNTLHQWYGSATKCVQATVCVSWRWHNSLHRGMWWNCSSHWLKYQDTLGAVVRFFGELSAHTHTYTKKAAMLQSVIGVEGCFLHAHGIGFSRNKDSRQVKGGMCWQSDKWNEILRCTLDYYYLLWQSIYKAKYACDNGAAWFFRGGKFGHGFFIDTAVFRSTHDVA